MYQVLKEDAFIQQNAAAFEGFLRYYEAFWVGIISESRRGRKECPIDLCFYDAIKNGDLMTTSNLEAWHRGLKSSFGVDPAFNIFKLDLIKQQDRVTQKLRDIRVNGPHLEEPVLLMRSSKIS